MKNNLAKQLARVSAAAAISMAAQSAIAHTGFRDVVQEGMPNRNAVNVTHGCVSGDATAGTASRDVIAVSAMFPNAADPRLAIVTKLDTAGAVIDTLDDLSGHIAGVLPGVGFTNLGLNTVQPSLFQNTITYIDTNTLLGAARTPIRRGFGVHNGNPFRSAPLYQSVSSAQGWVPFTTSPISFERTSCATELLVRAPTANWCLGGTRHNNDGSRADIWIGHATAKFNDPRTLPFMDPSQGTYWPTMRVVRNLATNPLPSSCGAGYRLAIRPTDADIDAWLPIPRGRPPAGSLQYYWPAR